MDQPSEHEPVPDDQFNTDYTKTFNPLTQATQLTASLSQLPSVASSVFSSFSSILKGNSPTPNTSNDQHQTDAYNASPALVDVPLLHSSLSYQSEETAVPPVVPTFYSAQDIPPAPTLSPPPSNSSSSNAYRLTTKRKIYAPAPGLSHQDNQSVPSAFPSHAPPLPYTTNEPNFQVNPTTTFHDTAVNQQPPNQNNKFSLTSFFATPLLEKITGSSSSHTQETPIAAVPDVFAVQSTNTVAPANTVNPGFYGTHPASEYIQPTFPAEQQPIQSSTPPLFFNPVQQQNLTTVNQTQSSVYGAIESVSNISSIPPSSIPPSSVPPLTVPPSGNVSSYRLRGKPHYKNPLSSTATTTPLVVPFAQATSSPAPSLGIFNPVNISRPSDAQVESNIGTGNTGQSIHSSGFTQQLPPPNISFFNQPQSVPVEPSAPPFNQFNPNNSGNVALGNDFPASGFDPFGRGNFLPPSIQSPQFNQTQATQLPIEQQQPVSNHPFQLQQQPNQFLVQSQSSELQPGLLHSDDTPLVEHTEHRRRSASIHYPIPSLDQAQLPLPLDLSHQQSEPVQETSQLQQLFQPPPTQITYPSEVEQPAEELPAIPLHQPSFANPFAVPTSHSESAEQQNFYQSNFTSDIFQQVQPQELCPTQHSSTAPSALNLYSQVEGQSLDQNTLPEEILDNTQTQLSNLNLHRNESSVEVTSLFQANVLPQGNTTTANLNQQIGIASTDRKNSSTFDNFFNTQTSQQPQKSEPVAPALASSFFATSPSNSSHTDWFKSSKPVEPSIKQLEGDINRNTQVASESETQDASSFFASTNKNQTSSQQPNYFQIQNFFNNPPLISDSKEQDNNFNFIENNLINKRLHNLTHKASTETDGGSISSNIVEPPSSAQSEFSEFNPETAQSDEYLGEQQV